MLKEQQPRGSQSFTNLFMTAAVNLIVMIKIKTKTEDVNGKTCEWCQFFKTPNN